MQQVFSIPKSMKKDFKYTFCPGCDHGVAIRLLAEIIDELGVQDKSICATSIGCSVFLYDFLDVDCIEAPHGRALAEATGVKRACPDKVVFTYQGDGDFASIGLGESMHAALRGEKITDDIARKSLITVSAAHGGKSSVGHAGQLDAVFGGGKHTWRLEQDLTLVTRDGKWRITRSEASTY